MTRITIKTQSEHFHDFRGWDLHELVSRIQEDMETYFDGKIHVRISWDEGWVEKRSGEPFDSDRSRKDVLL